MLSDLARGKLVLEIGSWLGRSTVAMARTALVVVAVDPHTGPPYRAEGSTFAEFQDNLRRCDVADRVVPIVAGFERAAQHLPRGYFDLAFIDAAHDYESVIRDGRYAWSCVRAGGILAFHDYIGQDGVYAAVNALAERWHTKPQVVEVGSLALLHRRVL